MGNLMVKYYPSLFFKILHEQHNPQVIKILSGFIAYHFKKGKFGHEVAVQIIDKVNEVVTNAVVRDVLFLDRKQLLIDFVKLIKLILENREHHQTVAQTIHERKLS